LVLLVSIIGILFFQGKKLENKKLSAYQ